MHQITKWFAKAAQAVTDLHKSALYDAAFIFSSVARNMATEESDLDVQVITFEGNQRVDIQNPHIDGTLDLTFLSIEQLRVRTDAMRTNNRIPMLAESIILF